MARKKEGGLQRGEGRVPGKVPVEGYLSVFNIFLFEYRPPPLLVPPNFSELWEYKVQIQLRFIELISKIISWKR